MRRSLLLALPLILPFMANDAQAAAAVTTAYQFAETTPLATGNWVRISTGESGVYEITYAELRTMGFSDPSKVAVYGLSGAVGEMNFLDIKGNRIIDDVIRPVRIMHTNDKILFYAEGPERLDFRMTGSGTSRREYTAACPKASTVTVPVTSLLILIRQSLYLNQRLRIKPKP